MNEIKVKKILPDKSRVTIQVMNVEFVFSRTGTRKIEIISKRKPDAQAHDPDACWVPANLFNQACRQAAAILLSPPKQQDLKQQIALFDEVPAR